MNKFSLDIVGPSSRALGALGHRVLQLNPWVFSVILVSLMFIKDGVGFYYVFEPAEVSADFPLPLAGPDASSFGWPLIVWALQIDSYRGLWLFPLMAIAASALVLTPILVKRFEKSISYAVATVVLLGPIPMSLLSHLGRHDFLVVIGGVILALSISRPLIAIVAALLMSLGNPEQAMVATMLLLVAVIALRRKDLRFGSTVAAVSASVYWIAVSVFLAATSSGSRLGTLSSVVPDASRIAVSNLPVLIWATYGLTAFALAAVLVSLAGWHRVALLGASLAPILLYFLGDQTRIGIAVATPIMIFSLMCALESLMRRLEVGQRQVALGFILVTALILPSVHVLYAGGVFEPYSFLIGFIS